MLYKSCDLIVISLTLRNIMNKSIEVHFLNEKGVSFVDIALKLGLNISEVAKLWAQAEDAKGKSKLKPKVVFRKRMTTSKLHHDKLSSKMQSLFAL